MQNLLRAENAEIASLQQIKADLQNAVAELSSKKESLAAEHSKLIEEHEGVKQDVASSQALFVQVNKDIDAAKSAHETKSEELNQKKVMLNAREILISQKEQETADEAAMVSEKHDKIRRLVNEIM